MKQKQIVILVAGALSTLWATHAAASGFQLLEQNASGLGNAYAGSAAVAEDASTIFFNPAGMTKLQSREVSAGFTPVITSYKFTNNGSSTGTLSGNGGDAGGTAVLPNAYLSWGLNKDLFLGLGIGVPFGLATEYDAPWYGAAQSILFDIKTVNINPSVAYRLNDTVSIGGGLNYMRMDVKYTRRLSVGTAMQGSTTTGTLKADSAAFGWNIGALFQVSPSTRVGVSYRSAVEQDLEGTFTFAGPVAGGSPASTNGDVKADIKLPDTFTLSVHQKLNPQWTMMGDLSRTGWSSIDGVDIVRTSGSLSGQTAQTLHANFRDTWRYALGANYELNSKWILKGGVAYDQTPVKDAASRLVSLPDNDRVWLSFGAQYKPTPQSRFDFGGSYLVVGDTDIDNDQTATLAGRVTGSYKGNVMILGAQYSQAF